MSEQAPEETPEAVPGEAVTVQAGLATASASVPEHPVPEDED